MNDPRDITPPLRDPEPRARGGMTVVDRSAWLAAINAAGQQDDESRRQGRHELAESATKVLRTADRLASAMEELIRAGADVESACGCYGNDVPDFEAASVIDAHWIYGPRFWAWWQGRQKPAKAPEPDAGHAAGAARARVPGDQIRTHTGWHAVTAAEHPAYPHVATESGMWFRGAILETRRKDEAKPTTLAAPPGCDPGGPARNVPIRVGDYVRALNTPLLRVVAVRGFEVTAVDAAQPVYGYMLQVGAVTEHRAAPRIVLPDGRAVVPERMWRQRSEFGNLEIVQVEGRCFVHRPSESWEPADYWTRNVPDPNYYRRVWPPADVEGV